MAAIRNARERARAELTREIKEAARRQLTESGAHGLSLRAVARELGMVSSALYRYFPSRDDLLTALIIDAYNEIGTLLEQADAAQDPADVRARWRTYARTVRGWALRSPHQFALVYGSPVPGYQAPQATVGPASRVPLALVAIVSAAHDAGTLAPPDRPLPAELAAQSAAVVQAVAPGTPVAAVPNTIMAWTQLFGMVGFELFGQLVGSMDPAEPFFEYSVEQMADLLGLR